MSHREYQDSPSSMGPRELNRNIVMTILNRRFIVYWNVYHGSTDLDFPPLSTVVPETLHLIGEHSSATVLTAYEHLDLQHMICQLWIIIYESSTSYRIPYTFRCWRCIFVVCRLYTQLGHWILITSGSNFGVSLRTNPFRTTEMRSVACSKFQFSDQESVRISEKLIHTN